MLVTISRSKIIVPVLLQPRCGGLLFSSNYSARYSHQIKMSTSASTSSCSPATADLCDDHVTSPTRLSVMGSDDFRDYGGVKSFHGKIETVRCFESNPMVRKTLMEPGNGRVLVVDGGGSNRVAILGDMLAKFAQDNGWKGIVVNGCIRDSKVIGTLNVGVKARGTHPLKSAKTHMGEKGTTVAFGGLEFVPGHWLYADEDGIVISEQELTFDSKL